MTDADKKLYADIRASYSLKSNDELVALFNSGTGLKCWGPLRSMHYKYLFEEFDIRGIDYSVLISYIKIDGVRYPQTSLGKKIVLHDTKIKFA